MIVPILLAAAGALAYITSFSGVFLFDDHFHIVDNPAIRALWPVGRFFEGTDRPLVLFSFALNYRVSGLEPWSYHAVNLAIHLAAGLVFMAILRRTFRTPALAGRFGNQADVLAFSAALLWLLHPVQTQSVTYLVQRAESLMGLFYFLTLYAAIRFFEQGARGWAMTAILSCILGTATKPVMMMAPITVLLYDRIFFGGSWSDIWRRRRGFYAGLAAGWLVLIALWLSIRNARHLNIGVGAHISPLGYFLAQTQVLLHYLKLVFWPRNLVLDYAWPLPQEPGAAWKSFLTLATFGLGTALAWLRSRPLGFLCALFFILLFPTSGFFPLPDLANEHRLYLALAVPVILFVMGAHAVLRRPRAVVVAILLPAGLLGFLTFQRNRVYASEEAMWLDVAIKRPLNPRAHYSLGNAHFNRGEYERAILCYEAALRIKPDYVKPLNNLGLAFLQLGKTEEAEVCFRKALEIMPDFPEAYNSLGLLYHALGRFKEAEDFLKKAVEISPSYAEAHNHLGMALAGQGKAAQAVKAYRKALAIKPDYAAAYSNLGNVLLSRGQTQEAIACYRYALEIEPGFAAAKENLKTAQACLLPSD